MRPLVRWLAILSLLAGTFARAADLPGPWVELASDGGLEIRAITAPGMPCPKVVADGVVLPSTMRGQPDAADGAYPVQVCAAHTTSPPRSATVDGVPVPTLTGSIKRIVVIGDTGCRLKGTFVQDCNDPVKWPFATVARLAAERHPDLVIHVAPAAPLLASAPSVLVRGNHEICSRGGHGWFRLLDPHPEAVDCTATTAPYALHVDPLHLLMFDGADADDDKADPAKVTRYRSQLQSLLAEAPAHAWLLTHRPIWALVEGLGAPQGATLNATEQAAIRGLVPPGLDMVLSGHIRDFTSYEFGPTRPAQLVVGEGGDANDAIVQPPAPRVAIDGLKLRRAFAAPDYGYVLLHRVSQGWTAVVYTNADQVLARCRMHGHDIACRPAAR